jgi:hypothetical protein
MHKDENQIVETAVETRGGRLGQTGSPGTALLAAFWQLSHLSLRIRGPKKR